MSSVQIRPIATGFLNTHALRSMHVVHGSSKHSVQWLVVFASLVSLVTHKRDSPMWKED